MANARLEILKNMPVFGGLTDAALTQILELSEHATVRRGDFFFRQGEDGNSTYVLERGQVVIVKSWEGRDYELGRYAAGDCFGEMALIDFGPRSASVCAVEDSDAIVLSPRCLLEVAKKDLEQYAMIYMNMARELSRRLRRADERLFRAVAEAEISDAEIDFSSV